MKKLFICFLLFFLISAHKTNGDDDKNISLLSLTNKQIQTVSSYDGYYADVQLLDGLPLIYISKVHGEKERPVKFPYKEETNLLKVIRPSNIPYNERIKLLKQNLDLIKDAQGFQPSTIVQNEIKCNDNGYYENKIIKFDYLDNNQIPRLSQWYDSETGFELGNSINSKDGKLIKYSIYLFLKYNNSFDGFKNKYKSKTVSLVAQTKSCGFNENELNNPPILEKFVKKVIENDMKDKKD